MFPGAKPDQIRAGRFGSISVATHAPANEDEPVPIFGPQAPGEEKTVSLLATMVPLGHALGDPLTQAPAPASVILIFLSVSPMANPLAEATP